MTRTILILLFCLCATAQAQFAPMRPMVHEGPAWTDYLVFADFEEAGTPSGWGTSGSTIDFDDTSNALIDAESLSIANNGTDATANHNLGTGYAEIWCAGALQVSGTPSAQEKVLILATSGFSQRGYLMLTTGMKIDGGLAGGTDTAASTVSVPTTGHVCVKVRYRKVQVSADAEVEVWVTSSTSSWGTSQISSNGTSTDNIQIIRPCSDSALGTGFRVTWDNFVIADEDIPIEFFK